MTRADTLVTPADRINPMLAAADVMIVGVRTASPFSTVIEAVLIFRDADCGFVPVVDAGRPVGVLTDRDVALALIEHGDLLPTLPVSRVMTKEVISVDPDAGLDAVMERLGDRGGVRRVLVVDDEGTMLGVISWADLAPHVSSRALGAVAEETLTAPTRP